MQKHDYCAGEKLGQAEGERRNGNVLEAVNQKHTHNCVGQYLAQPRNKRGRFSFSAENEKGYAAQKVRYRRANEDYKHRMYYLFIRHFSYPPFLYGAKP